MFSFYHMVPRATDPHSLLMNAGQVSRFAAPLAFNFLHVVRMQAGLRNGQVGILPCLYKRQACWLCAMPFIVVRLQCTFLG